MKTKIGLVTALLLGGACSGNAGRPQTSGSSHWFKCQSFADCAGAPGAVACREQRCVDDEGEPIAKDAQPPAPVAGSSAGEPDAGGASGAGAARDAGPADAGMAGSSVGSAGASGGGGAGGSGGGGGTGGAAMSCREGYEPPLLDRSCIDVSDCFAGVHIIDCCGTKVSIGYSRNAQAAFEAYEAPCRTTLCACPEDQPRAEDGSLLSAGEPASVACIGGRCFARGPNSEACSGAQECIDPEDGGACVPATGPTGGRCRGASGICFLCMCASPDTPIATPDGERPIAALKPGDLVYSIDADAIRVVPIARVSRTPVFHHQVVRVSLASGRKLEISGGHPTADGRWFSELQQADQLGGVSIEAVELIDYGHAFTYDVLPASSTGTYFAAGVPIGSTLF